MSLLSNILTGGADGAIGSVAGLINGVLDRVIPDPTVKEKAKEALAQLQISGDLQQMMQESKITLAGADIVKAEASSQSWLTCNWRPMTMMVFVFIIFNNYILFPYCQLFFHAGASLALPPDMWELLKIGLGGYVVGRSGEKIAKALKGMQS